MRKKKVSILFVIIPIFLFVTPFIRAEFGKLPPGALVSDQMGKTSEIVLYLVFDPSLIQEKIPNNIRLLLLAEMAKNDREIDSYLQTHPEHKNWAWSFFEIIGTESLVIDNRTADFGQQGGMAVWYGLAEQKQPADPRARGTQMLVLGTWLSDTALASYVRRKGMPWENGEIKYWKDQEGVIHGHLNTKNIEVRVICRLRGKPYKPEIKLPAYQTFWSPLPYPNTFEVVTFYGHRVQNCTAEWTFKGSHSLVRAYDSRATGGLFISGTEYAWDYVLQGALYKR